MSHPVMFCGDEGCGEQLRCVQVGVWVRDQEGVRAGDVYACPTCHRETILGAPQPVRKTDTDPEAQAIYERVIRALDTAATPYVCQQYVVKCH